MQRFKLGIANSVVNIENSSLSSMGTEQLISMFNKEDNQKQNTNKTSIDRINQPSVTNNFQRIQKCAPLQLGPRFGFGRQPL